MVCSGLHRVEEPRCRCRRPDVDDEQTIEDWTTRRADLYLQTVSNCSGLTPPGWRQREDSPVLSLGQSNPAAFEGPIGVCVRRGTAIKILAIVAALGGLGVLFVRSAQSTRAEPYEVEKNHLAPWTLAIDPMPRQSGALLVLRPQADLAAGLFNQLFLRSGESLRGPNPVAMPLVLESELGGTATAVLTPDALLALARESGLESTRLEPRCMSHRRVSQPGLTRQVYFLRFTSPTFDEFRERVARRLSALGSATPFDPAALTPVVIIAASDAAFNTWLPLQLGAVDDCLAPIAVR